MKWILALLVCTSVLASESSFDLGDPATTIECKWIANHEGGLRFERLNGQLDSIPASDMKWVSNVKGKVLDKTPVINVVTHVMHCKGGQCEPSKTIVIEHWPSNAHGEAKLHGDRLPKPITK